MAKLNLALVLLLAATLTTMWRTRPSYWEDTLEISKEDIPVPKLKASELQRLHRLMNAQELLGRYYNRSAVRQGEGVNRMNGLVYAVVRERLPAKYKGQYKKIAQAIIDESQRNEFDPVLVVSVILGESSFNPDCKGPLDEIGLMQIRPATGEWIAKKYGFKWHGNKTLHDPVANIQLGTAYLNHLRGKFDSHARLYLAAYNMGARNVDRARGKDIWPKDYPQHVMKRYVDFYEGLEGRPVRTPATNKHAARGEASPSTVE